MTVDQFVLNFEIIFSIWTQIAVFDMFHPFFLTIFHFLCNLLILIVVDVMERRPCRESGSCFWSRGEEGPAAAPPSLFKNGGGCPLYHTKHEALGFFADINRHWIAFDFNFNKTGPNFSRGQIF